MDNKPAITAVNDIASSPEEVWKVLTDFARYAEWHPALRFIDVPAEILPGTQLQAQLTLGTENDGEYIFTVVDHDAPRRLAWEGGIPDVLMGLHSFVLEPHDGGTRFTESEEFTGTAAVESVEPARAQMEEGSASYVRALKKRVESGQ
ncbi:SRPBCC domain-containing protein [Streptomyces sp. IB201691-2A2]|uniref:SRPBCC domain-containing protein n=1 Tax=Streptomyces sp. IB201691-2A2 TaxID=2561920 RepID=UPI00117C49C0|nr:SRPBCC domain-containing protein [Streptomyces sp. IB201691-2A2]TRO55565.1 SRPBCC domain-containing protein [Streptomyces sp. IB201691-2A2]